MVPLSVLDLSPIVQGGSASQALHNTLDLARHVERWGYRRFWLAEHHNMPGIASAATAVVMGHVASGTSTIRVGAGGIMLPNHAPLVIAEQFGTLEALYPGRIELGLGRAPGTDQVTAHALRRSLESDADAFPQDVVELMAYFREPEPGQRVRAIPGMGLHVPIWILGSSLFGAQLAAALGLPYAFASHFAPAAMTQAIQVYRSRFKPSAQLDRPYVMLGLNVFAAPTDEEARFLMTSLQQSFLQLRTGNPGPLPPPIEHFERRLSPAERMMLDQALSCSVVGSPETVREGLRAFVDRTGADELMVTSHVYDHAARLRSFEIAANARDELARANV
ncbi:LLM class flavin-dependent oxidoreductase [Polyangium jinanense]|uniref:LLM class flavin-dependent oxidoreductase n=1 Tax=Polyangium jinanense TaxID=2829994 RepID=UPI00234018FF|nr:LLM class flavin-dependent oxidoreductase [Polyangium jinanense]MDC3955205.1 LLM class flavin-dependent oxidoreductase [Polyangium jinanense]